MEQVLIFKKMDLFPSANKMIRMHWAERKKLHDQLCWEIKSQNPKKFNGKVKIIFERKAIKLMDWDNFSASFKMAGDALIKCGVIIDDNPSIVTEFISAQTKVGTKADEQITITIKT